MKKLLISGLFLVVLSIPLSSQWYNNKYHVSDINDLSLDQLLEAKTSAKTGLITSLGCAGIGGLAILSGHFLPAESSDDPTLLEQIIGPKGMSYLVAGTGVVFAVGGVVGTLVFSGRLMQINRTMQRNFPALESIRFYPGIIRDKYSGKCLPGVSFSVRF